MCFSRNGLQQGKGRGAASARLAGTDAPREANLLTARPAHDLSVRDGLCGAEGTHERVEDSCDRELRRLAEKRRDR